MTCSRVFLQVWIKVYRYWSSVGESFFLDIWMFKFVCFCGVLSVWIKIVCMVDNKFRCVYVLRVGAMVAHQEGSGKNAAVFHLHDFSLAVCDSFKKRKERKIKNSVSKLKDWHVCIFSIILVLCAPCWLRWLLTEIQFESISSTMGLYVSVFSSHVIKAVINARGRNKLKALSVAPCVAGVCWY